MIKKNIKAYIAWINICVFWGTTYLAIRIGVADMPPMLFAGFRWILSGTILFSFLKIRNYKLPDKKDFLHSAIIGIFLLGFGNGLVVVAEQWIESGITSLLLTTVPFWIVALEMFLQGSKKINLQIILGLLLGLAGVVLILSNNLKYLFNLSHFIGIISLLLAVVMWSIGTVYSKYKKTGLHPLMSASIQMLVAGVLQSILGIILGELPNFNIHLNSTLAFFYLLIFGSLIGYTSFIYAVSHLPISLVSTYSYINPVIAVFLGWFILGESVSIMIIIASIVIITGVVIVKKGNENLYRQTVSGAVKT
jgi:drug/metabolite transporter (DMT)-like permease